MDAVDAVWREMTSSVSTVLWRCTQSPVWLRRASLLQHSSSLQRILLTVRSVAWLLESRCHLSLPQFRICTASIVSGTGSMKRYGVRPSVRPSVCRSMGRAHSSKPAAAGLLLWTRRAGDIDRLLQQRRPNAGSATLSAYAGSWTQTCYIEVGTINQFYWR